MMIKKMSFSYKVLVLLILASIGLSGCGGDEDSSTPTADPAVEARILEAVVIGLTQTSSAVLATKPVDTAMPMLPTSPPPTVASGIATLPVPPTQEVAPPAQNSETPPTQAADSGKKCKYRAALAYESPKDDAWIADGKEFTRIWTITNTGDCPWPAGTALRATGGELFGADATQIITDVEIAVGDNVKVQNRLKIPSLKLPENDHVVLQGYWMLLTPPPTSILFGSGENGKGNFWLKINACGEQACKLEK